MRFNRKEVIDWLKLEIDVIERGGYHPSVREPRKQRGPQSSSAWIQKGYNPSVREPRKQPRIFRDSVSCLNMGLEEKLEPCEHCFLIDFVPAEHHNEPEPCHYIPLNEKGDTVASLEAQGRHQEALDALLGWLKSTVAKLESQPAKAK